MCNVLQLWPDLLSMQYIQIGFQNIVCFLEFFRLSMRFKTRHKYQVFSFAIVLKNELFFASLFDILIGRISRHCLLDWAWDAIQGKISYIAGTLLGFTQEGFKIKVIDTFKSIYSSFIIEEIIMRRLEFMNVPVSCHKFKDKYVLHS